MKEKYKCWKEVKDDLFPEDDDSIWDKCPHCGGSGRVINEYKLKKRFEKLEKQFEEMDREIDKAKEVSQETMNKRITI